MHEANKQDDVAVVELGQYWRTIKKSKWLILTITILCVVLGGLIAKNTTPTYKASVKILADPQKPTTNAEKRNISSVEVALFYETQFEIINSRKIAESVVDKLGLVDKYKNDLKNGKAKKDDKNVISSILSAIGLSKLVEDKDADKNKKPLTDEEIRIKIAKEIQEELSIDIGKQSQIIDINFVSVSPEDAVSIVNTLSEAYIKFGLETRLSELKDTETWLSNQSALLKSALGQSEARLSQYRLQQGLVNTEQQQNLVNNQLQSLNSELIRAQTRLSAAEEQYLAVKNVKANARELYSLGIVLQNRTTSDMVKEQARLSQRVNELFERYGEKHPKMIAARSELKSATENLATEVNKVVESIEKDYRLARVQVSNIEKLITESRNSIQSLQSENFSLVSLEREVDNNRRIYENFQISLLQATGNSEYNVSNIHIIDKATKPKEPFAPNIKLIGVLSMMFGLVFGILIAFIREALDNTFKTSENIEKLLSVPAIGVTPLVNKHGIAPEKKYLEDSLSPFAESINTIRTGLLFSNIDTPPKTMLITSAGSNEGKSTLAINLAAAFSSIGKTLLLEVDLRKPFFAECFEMKSNRGLTDLVTGSDLSEDNGLHHLNDGKLSVISGGTMIRNPIELLSSNKFDKVLDTLKQHYEYIILDGPPTLPVSDSCILANKVDTVIFTVRAQKTKVSVAQEAISRLKKLNANVTGTVLTVADPKKMSYYGDNFHTGEFYGVKPKTGDSPKPVAAV